MKGGMTDVGSGVERHANLGISCVSFDLDKRKALNKTLDGEWARDSLSPLYNANGQNRTVMTWNADRGVHDMKYCHEKMCILCKNRNKHTEAYSS